MNCKGLFGWMFGHKYEARYSRAFPQTSVNLGEFKGSVQGYERMVDAWKNTTYHGDICTRCGHFRKEAA